MSTELGVAFGDFIAAIDLVSIVFGASAKVANQIVEFGKIVEHRSLWRIVKRLEPGLTNFENRMALKHAVSSFQMTLRDFWNKGRE